MSGLNALSEERAQDGVCPERGSKAYVDRTGKRSRTTISLSEKSMRAVREIKELTDADSDSEVFRNALRLYLSLLRAHQDGKLMYLKDDKQGAIYPIELFLPVE